MSGFKENLKATGKLNIKHLSQDGKLINEYNFNNLVVTSGLEFITKRMANTGIPTQMTHMGIGEGSATAVLGNTGLGTPLGARKLLDTAGGVPSGTTITYQASFGPDAQYAGDVTEAGIFNASSGPTMLCRTVFNPIALSASDSLAISWDITIS